MVAFGVSQSYSNDVLDYFSVKVHTDVIEKTSSICFSFSNVGIMFRNQVFYFKHNYKIGRPYIIYFIKITGKSENNGSIGFSLSVFKQLK